MKQTREGSQWYFGMKAYIRIDAVTGLTHRVATTSANVADVTMAGHLIRGDDEKVYGYADYLGMGKSLDKEKGAPDSWGCIVVNRGAIKKSGRQPDEDTAAGD